MTDPETAAPRRASRLGLYGPFVVVAIALAAWSGGWWWLKGEVLRGLDTLAQRRESAGGAFIWQSRSVHGYPFRLDVDFTRVAWREPTGWAIAAPTLKTQISLFAPGHWVAYAPDGAVLGRPEGGAVTIAAKALRASASDLTGHPPSFSLEAIGLVFTPATGAAPYFLHSAAELHIHTRAAPNDQGEAFVEVDRAAPAPDGALGRIAAGKPLTLTADAVYSHAGALAGPSWAGAVAAWAGAGGQLRLRRLHLHAGETVIDADGTGLTANPDGRLAGALDVSLSQGPRALTAMNEAGMIDAVAARMAGAVLQATHAGKADHATLTFQAGRTTLGPVALGAAPKVY